MVLADLHLHLHLKPNLGMLLIGSYLNLILYTLELVAVYLYFANKRSKRDHPLITFAVCFTLFTDTLASFAVCADVFAICVLFWGDTSKTFVPQWSHILWIISNSLGPFVVQIFMVLRYWRLSSNYPISIFIFLLMLVSLALLFQLAIQTAGGRLKNLRTAFVTLALVAVTDLSITAALLWRLYNTRTYSRSEATESLLKRISIVAIISGGATCIVVICILIMCLVFPKSYFPLLFGYMLGRVYSLTMLFTLLYRDKLDKDPWMHVNMVDLLPAQPTSHPMEGPSFSYSSMTFAQHELETARNSDHFDCRTSSTTLDFPPPAKIVTR